MQPVNSPLGVVRSVRSSLRGLKILDIGCGSGGFVRELVAEGADVSGVDPGTEAIRKAALTAPQANFTEGFAEELPYGDGSFDMAVMVNSLHHVPKESMLKALAEAARVTRRDGALVIIEPLASGSFFAALQPIEDETVVRHAAQRSIEDAISSGILCRKGARDYLREDAFPDVKSFLGFVVAVDPARQAVVDANVDAITANVLAAAHHADDDALRFEQPMKVDILGRS